MIVEMLYTEGCRNAADYLPRLQQLLSDAELAEPIRTRIITSPEQAQRGRFLGSPTIRINGHEVDPSADQRQDYGLSCRLYTGTHGLRGTPPDDWVLTVLRAQTENPSR